MQQNLIDAARAVIAADRAGELTDEHIQALEAAANAEAAPVAHKLLRKNHNGQWVDDGRYWIDGAPDEGLMENVRINQEQWSVLCAYSHSLAADMKPAGELVAHVKRGTNTSFIDSTGCNTCWEDLPDGTALYAAQPVPSDAFALLEIWQTWLGAGRESCSEHDKPLWDRIDAVLASKEPKHD